jgi:hypothetical protein
VGRSKTPEDFPVTKRLWTPWLAEPQHPDRAEHSAWVAEVTGSDQPFDPAFLDISAANQALADQF